MDLFMQKIFSAYLVVLTILGFLMLVIIILRHLIIGRTIRGLTQLPDDRKQKMIDFYSTVLPVYGVALRVISFDFLLLIALVVLSFVFPELAADIHPVLKLGGLSLILGFIYFAEDSYYKKKILKALDKSI